MDITASSAFKWTGRSRGYI